MTAVKDFGTDILVSARLMRLGRKGVECMVKVKDSPEVEMRGRWRVWKRSRQGKTFSASCMATGLHYSHESLAQSRGRHAPDIEFGTEVEMAGLGQAQECDFDGIERRGCPINQVRNGRLVETKHAEVP